MKPQMPHELRQVRTTSEFTHESTPNGLRKAHRVATGVWGRLVVNEGSVDFVFEDDDAGPLRIEAMHHVDIPPDTPHHVVTHPGCRFVVEFYALK